METSTACQTSTAMILTCQKIARSFAENIYELSSVRTSWNPDYGAWLNDWINDTIGKYYMDSLHSIDDKSYREWHEVMVAGLQSLKVLRAALKVDFKDDKPFLREIFQKLGYDEYFSDAKNGDHLSLYRFLETFAKNLDEADRKRITGKDVPDALFQKILAAAGQIQEYKCCFEKLEGEADLTSEALTEVKKIYETIQDICRIAIAYYQFDPIKRDEFNFYKVMVNL